ncbi:MAG: preprotein translocase subunit SecA [Rubrivivax sp.]|nr:preprotein translocase subunit SecA [Rubrivivax sp.]
MSVHATALDPTFVRALAGSSFRRADTVRDERGADRDHAVERFLRGLAGWLPTGQESRRSINRFAAAVQQQAQTLSNQDDAAVAARFHTELQVLKQRCRGLDDEARVATVFACLGEASRRRLGLWPHPVQWAGARVMLGGRLAEMPTGEGKTLVAALAATAMAGAGAAVHVVTTNDYLARRDCEGMAPLFDFFGLRGAFIEAGQEPDVRRDAYRAPVCYVSGKELVFDYLKDRLAGHGTLPTQVQRLRLLCAPGAEHTEHEPMIPALHFAIVDEADSVLIDEARTPMILSREAPGLMEPALLDWAIGAARGLQPGPHYHLPGTREVELLPAAVDACPPLPEGVRAVWRARSWRTLLLRQALTALHLFHRDQHYILADGKVQIVDESTGRVMADRSWEQGLHQLIEAKEGLAQTAGRETLARMTFQRFFRRYYLLAGLTGTAAEAARELWAVYGLRVRRVPPNRPLVRRRLPSLCLREAATKWPVVAQDAADAAARGQAVLIGTRSVQASEQIAAECQRRGLPHVVLNARQDAEEAAIVAAAGGSGRITIATNMAGRGTDIKPDAAALQAGGLHVILTEFHESPRVDRQLFGRSARQGQPGTVRAIVAADDALFTRQAGPAAALLRQGLAPRAMLAVVRWLAQTAAEHRAHRTRMQTLKQDRELNRLIGFSGPTA